MSKKEFEFSVDASLKDVLTRDDKWKVAYNSAKELFDDLVAFLVGRKATEPLNGGAGSIVQRFYSKTLNSRQEEFLVGSISLTECFGIPSILLEVRLRDKRGKSRHGVEFLFDKQGTLLHAAV